MIVSPVPLFRLAEDQSQHPQHGASSHRWLLMVIRAPVLV
jgi:hypothetical protein